MAGGNQLLSRTQAIMEMSYLGWCHRNWLEVAVDGVLALDRILVCLSSRALSLARSDLIVGMKR